MMTEQPTGRVVMVHGAYADGSSWADVIQLLQQAGVSVTSVQNPLTSLADDAAATRRALDLQDGPTVLVGHSWAGTVISEVGEHPNVAGLVYVAARAPDVGEDYAALAGKFQAAGLGRTQLRRRLRPARRGDVPRALRQRRTRGTRASAVRRAGPHRRHALLVPHHRGGVRTRPCWYTVSKQDHTTTPDLERFVANRMDATTIEVDGGHLSMITHPRVIADLILEAIRRRRRRAPRGISRRGRSVSR